MSLIGRRRRCAGMVAVALALAGIASGCGSDSSSTASAGSNSGSSQSAGKPQITMLSASNVIPGWLAYEAGAKKAAKRLNVDLRIVQWASLQPSDLVAGINAVAASNPDAALFSAVQAAAEQSALEEAAKRIKTVVLFGTRAEDGSFAAGYVGSSAAEQGVAAAKRVAELIGDKGKVLQTEAAPSFGGLMITMQAFRDEMKKNHPNIDLLPLQFDQGDTSKNAAIVRATLARHPDLAGAYLGTSGLGGEGGVGALREAGKIGQVKVVTMDGLPAAIDDLRKGYQQTVVSPKLEDLGGGAVEAAVKAMKGEPVEKEHLVGFCMLTKENLDAPENQQCITPAKK
jgi:ribose transport system substrate-binding protein